jgi:hypothetical protein
VSYIGLGSRDSKAALDTTGLNGGNYTNAFTPALISSNVPFLEIYHMVVTNVPANAQATIFINNKYYGFCFPNVGSEWNPAQPILLNPGDEVDFCWNITASGPAPLATIYLRYDPLIQGISRIPM